MKLFKPPRRYSSANQEKYYEWLKSSHKSLNNLVFTILY